MAIEIQAKNPTIQMGIQGPRGEKVQPDWSQNDETAKDYVKNRPGAYDVISPSIEWDGNTDGKTVISMGDLGSFTNFKLVKVSDEFIPADQLIGKTLKYTSTQIKEGQPQVLDFPMDESNTLQEDLDTGGKVTFVILGSGDDMVYWVFSLNQPDEGLGIPEAGTYFGDFIVFMNSMHTSLLPAREEAVKLPAKYIDLDNINTSIQEISKTLEPLPQEVDSLQNTSTNFQKRLDTVEYRAKNAQDRLYKIENCVSINSNPQQAIIYYVASIKDTTEIVDITLPEESKTISIYFEPKAEFNIINKASLSFVGSDSQYFPAKQYNMQTSKWVNLHRTRATNYDSWAYVDDNGQLAVLYVAPDDVGKTVAMTREYTWKTIKLPDRSGFYSKEYVLIEYTRGTYVQRIDVSGDWTSESEPSISGKGVRQITFSTLERIEQLTDDYINDLIDAKLGTLKEITEIKSVDALPENPDPSILYLVREEG